MNALSIKSWLITLFIVILILGLRRIVWTSRITALLFSVQPANTRREAAYIHDSLPHIQKKLEMAGCAFAHACRRWARHLLRNGRNVSG